MKMQSSMISLTMLGLIFSLAMTSAEAAVRRTDISPELEPTSSKKFFDKDYPADDRAHADPKHYVFGHPYPAVQDSNDFDKDFVKDENSDGGKWQAQMDYDTLRAKIRHEQDELDALKKKMEEEYAEWQRAKDKAGKHDEGLEQARKDVEAARKAAGDAAKRVNDLEGASQDKGTGIGGAIGDAIKDVQKEMDDLEACKKALAEAKQKLKDLLEKQAKEKEEGEKEAKDEKTKEDEKHKEEEKKAEEEKVNKEKEGKEGKDGKKDGKDKKGDHEETEEEFKKEIEKDEKSASDWRKEYLKELQDVKETEKELEAAAKVLKKFRRPPYVDDNGGVYNVPDSLAATHTPAGLVMMVVAMAAAMC